MASDIILDDDLITFDDAERVVATKAGRSVEIDLIPNATLTVGTDEHRGLIRVRGRGARVLVADGAVQAEDLVARGEVRVGSRGEGGIAAGSLSIQGSGPNLLLEVDGATGVITIDGHGDLRDRLAELQALRSTVAQMEARIRALEAR